MKPETMVEIVLGLVMAKTNNGESGPFAVIVDSKYEAMLTEQYSKSPNKTLDERLLQIAGIQEVVVDSKSAGITLRDI